MMLCGRPMPKARNGNGRGVCSLPYNHIGSNIAGGLNHGNGTCPDCGVKLTLLNAKPSAISKGSGKCRICLTMWTRNRRGGKEKNTQKPGKSHTFPCGCSGTLPMAWGAANEFAIRASSTGSFGCRVSSILSGSQATAKRDGYTPIPLNTPHTVIRNMMADPNCERCGKPLFWSITLGSRPPHLHHNHETGEIYGFTHPKCNPQALEQEIERLKGLLKGHE